MDVKVMGGQEGRLSAIAARPLNEGPRNSDGRSEDLWSR